MNLFFLIFFFFNRYTWTVSFIGPDVGDMPALTVDTNTLTGDGVVAAIAETRKGTLRTVQKIV